MSREVDVLDTQLQAFKQPHAAAVQWPADQQPSPSQLGEDQLHFLAVQNQWQPFGLLGTNHALDQAEILFEHSLVQEQQRIECLTLGRCADVASDGQIREELLHFGGTHFLRVAHMMEKNVTPNPVDIGFFRPGAVVQGPDCGSDAVQELGLFPNVWTRPFTPLIEGS